MKSIFRILWLFLVLDGLLVNFRAIGQGATVGYFPCSDCPTKSNNTPSTPKSVASGENKSNQSGSNPFQTTGLVTDNLPEDNKTEKSRCRDIFDKRYKAISDEKDACDKAAILPFKQGYDPKMYELLGECNVKSKEKIDYFYNELNVCLAKINIKTPSSQTFKSQNPSVNPSPNSNGLSFVGSPEQQANAKRREEEALKQQQQYYQQQQKIANIGNIAGGVAQLLGDAGNQRNEALNKKLDETRGDIDKINSRGDTHYQLADKGQKMQNAQRNNGSMDDVGPGQEEDDEEVNRLTGLTDEQFERERQRYLERSANQSSDSSNPGYTNNGTSRLAESEAEIRQKGPDSSAGAKTSNTNASENSMGSGDAETLSQSIQDFLTRIKDKNWNWAEFTDEEKAKAAYIGYAALSAAQATIGGLMYNNGGALGKLIGPGLEKIPISDMQKIQNPFLRNWPKN